VTLSPQLELHGVGANVWRSKIPPKSAERRVLLMHYPLQANQFKEERFDLMLAGHSHGGQVRVPLYGAPIVPHGVGRYDWGLFDTPAGPLYVNAGIGWYRLPVRLNCRPELAVVTI
jgi:predicted MPP superfamily phosphohydrolase